MNQTEASSANTKWIAAGSMVAGTSLLVALTVPFVFLPTSKKAMLPYMATPSAKLRQALQFIADTTTSAKGQRRRTFLDLGSGDGESVKVALSILHPHSRAPMFQHATGVELNSTLWLLSNLRRLFWNADQRARSSFVCRDFWKSHLQTIDTILIFGVQPLMVPLSVKLAKECRPGTHVLSYRFPLPLRGSSPPTTATTNDGPLLLHAKLVYDKEEMRIYECVQTD